MRVSPPRVTLQPARAPRPPAGSPSADAHRQAGFVLGGDLDLAIEGLELEGAIVEASTGAAYRKQATAAAMATWSRSWLARLDAVHAIENGNYAAALALLRSATDALAAAISLGTDPSEWQEWLDGGGIGPRHDQHATEFRLHAFRSAETLARIPRLGSVYRAVSDLSMPSFGATVLLAASASDAARVAVTFGDRDFHLGLAELALGFALELSLAAVETFGDLPGVFAAPDAGAVAKFRTSVQSALGRPDRCVIQDVEIDGERRYLIRNWRRAPGAAHARLVL